MPLKPFYDCSAFPAALCVVWTLIMPLFYKWGQIKLMVPETTFFLFQAFHWWTMLPSCHLQIQFLRTQCPHKLWQWSVMNVWVWIEYVWLAKLHYIAQNQLLTSIDPKCSHHYMRWISHLALHELSGQL